jgi:hypothetical protein
LSTTTKGTFRIFTKWPSAAYNIAKILFKGKEEPQHRNSKRGSKVSKVSKASRNYVETVIFIRTSS